VPCYNFVNRLSKTMCSAGRGPAKEIEWMGFPLSSAAEIRANLERVRQSIAVSAGNAGRDPASVRLIAVSKTFPAEKIIEAYACGQRDFGENRVQEFRQKREQLRLPEKLPEARFHLIGHLQSNKVSLAVAFHWIETLDSERLARRLNEAAAQAGKIMPALIEVKLGAEEAKTGVPEQETAALASVVDSLGNLNLRGLMTIPPHTPDPEGARPYFRRLRELRDRLRAAGFRRCEELSMGMTRDFPIAIEEGATMVRIGTAIFGPRARTSEPQP
jgi:PLP dependent protein